VLLLFAPLVNAQTAAETSNRNCAANMPSQHWQNLKAIFHAALALSPEERAAYLAKACEVIALCIWQWNH
jgi:hypothetical protein